ncbi:hypothetical protein [Micromonospora sp. NPDC005299]|uniref:hypothetical protein n=1 Tax=Micromonospora sp. NPDC005299 TaxID=3364231 RepID=UPI0036862813
MASNNSPRASSIWPQMPFMRGPAAAQRLREWLPQYRQQRNEIANRRERVLAYDWACKRLCQILSLSHARNWNGYVPPYKDADGRVNTYETRRELIELLREVAAADRAGQEPAE